MGFTPWRSNIISCYLSTDVIGTYRKCVFDILDAIAFVHALDCVATKDNLLSNGDYDRKNPLASAPICDVVYFRSTPETRITLREFEKMIASIFEKPSGDTSQVWFVCPMLHSRLKEYPYPKD